MNALIQIRPTNKIQIVRDLFSEYAESLRFGLDFQNFEKEMTELPGEYAPPDGLILVARYKAKIAGCVALRKISDQICEMKRLYVRESYRRQGIGRRLAEAVIEVARHTGYRSMRLDTVPGMVVATTLYRSLGFSEIGPYRHNPIQGALYFELKL